jgi:dTDP-4-dehydrorhamnose 3,5-epimerase
MEFERLAIPDVLLVRPRVFRDPRGYFVETWESRRFAAAGIAQPFVQDNLSRSGQFTLRGLHYQVRQPQGKLVRITSGTVFDVAVDVRRSSATFGTWVGATLSEENQHALWVPPGFAHGFLVLSESATFAYKCTDFYAPEWERTIRWDDADLAIKWPLPPDAAPVLSAKDANGTRFKAAEVFE